MNDSENILQLESSWNQQLASELQNPYFIELVQFLNKEWHGPVPIYPARENIFRAFRETPFNKVKVLILGQDPYHGPGQAHGLAFSVPEGIPPPPSLVNIFKELHHDLSLPRPAHGCLQKWAAQGVLLLNATLTVREGEPLSHRRRGWENFTDAVVKALYDRDDPVVFVLWGKSAQEKCKFLTGSLDKQKYILMAAHPSPLSAHNGFFGCRHFSKINALLVEMGKDPIDWGLKQDKYK